MKKTKATKVEGIIVKKEVKLEKHSEGIYHLFIDLNDKTYELDTDDIGAAIMSFRPEILKTSLTIKVTKGNKTLDRYLYLKDAKRLFMNSITLEAFVRNLMF